MQQLPYIDEHSQQIEAPVDAVWAALLKVLRQMNGSGPLAPGFWAAIPRKALPVSPIAALTRQCPVSGCSRQSMAGGLFFAGAIASPTTH